MRITAGRYKNKRIITSLKSAELKYKPTTERTRMAIFNMISHSKFIDEALLNDAIVADICCGSGAFGLEALSRGASKIYFIDRDPSQIKLVKKNISNLKEEQRAVFLSINAENISNIEDKVNIVFIDPPYNQNLTGKILESISKKKIVASRHVVIMETAFDEDINLINEFKILDSRRYGKAKITFGRFNS